MVWLKDISRVQAPSWRSNERERLVGWWAERYGTSSSLLPYAKFALACYCPGMQNSLLQLQTVSLLRVRIIYCVRSKGPPSFGL